MHSLNHKQTNGNFSAALSASVSGSNLWCAERLTSVRKQRQDKEGPFSPVWSLRVAFSQAASTVWQLHGRRPAKTLRTLERRGASIMPFQELCATRKANVLPQTIVQRVISADAVSHLQIAAACVCISLPRGFHSADLRGRPSVTVIFALRSASG